MKKLKKFTVLASLDGQFHLLSYEYYTKKAFVNDLKGNGFKFKYKDVKEFDVYDLVADLCDKWAWDNIHTMKEYDKYIKDKDKYEIEKNEKKYQKNIKTIKTKYRKINEKLEIEIKEIEKNINKKI